MGEREILKTSTGDRVQLKDYYNAESIREVATRFKSAYAAFNADGYVDAVLGSDALWSQMELKERMHHMATAIKPFLPDDFLDWLPILEEVSSGDGHDGLVYMFLPDIVEQFGQEYWQESMDCLSKITGCSTSEFAVRPFILQKPEEAMALMLKWSKSDDYQLRRLSSEGCRPLLPWSNKLRFLTVDPTSIFEILENLKEDSEVYVQKSVANNLNDISKNHPDSVLTWCENNYGKSKITDWIIKRALRTLLKQANPRALAIFGYAMKADVQFGEVQFSIDKPTIGEHIHFHFDMHVKETTPQLLRLEYAVDFLKKNGKHNRKIFQLSEKEFIPGTHKMKQKHSFKQMSTRKHYAGLHKITVLLNGQEQGTYDILLQE